MRSIDQKIYVLINFKTNYQKTMNLNIKKFKKGKYRPVPKKNQNHSIDLKICILINVRL